MIPRGFRFSETMAGTYKRIGETDVRPFSFTVDCVADSVTQYIKDRKVAMAGTVDAPGLATGTELAGFMTLDPVFGRIIRYEFGFAGDDGRSYRFEGQKNVSIFRLKHSLSNLPGHIYDDGGLAIATADTKFDVSADILPFLASWRPT